MVQGWQIRVMAERMTLYENLDKLEAFIADDEKTANLSPRVIALLIAQSFAMRQYLEILDRRIVHFTKD